MNAEVAQAEPAFCVVFWPQGQEETEEKVGAEGNVPVEQPQHVINVLKRECLLAHDFVRASISLLSPRIPSL
jgi:hypothetical protein